MSFLDLIKKFTIQFKNIYSAMFSYSSLEFYSENKDKYLQKRNNILNIKIKLNDFQIQRDKIIRYKVVTILNRLFRNLFSAGIFIIIDLKK